MSGCGLPRSRSSATVDVRPPIAERAARGFEHSTSRACCAVGIRRHPGLPPSASATREVRSSDAGELAGASTGSRAGTRNAVPAGGHRCSPTSGGIGRSSCPSALRQCADREYRTTAKALLARACKAASADARSDAVPWTTPSTSARARALYLWRCVFGVHDGLDSGRAGAGSLATHDSYVASDAGRCSTAGSTLDRAA
jgi:hypothetical protein